MHNQTKQNLGLQEPTREATAPRCEATPAQKWIELAKRRPQYCAIQRNALLHHRSQIQFLGQLYRENKGPWNLRLIRSHADEIRNIHATLDREAELISNR